MFLICQSNELECLSNFKMKKEKSLGCIFIFRVKMEDW